MTFLYLILEIYCILAINNHDIISALAIFGTGN